MSPNLGFLDYLKEYREVTEQRLLVGANHLDTLYFAIYVAKR